MYAINATIYLSLPSIQAGSSDSTILYLASYSSYLHNSNDMLAE